MSAGDDIERVKEDSLITLFDLLYGLRFNGPLYADMLGLVDDALTERDRLQKAAERERLERKIRGVYLSALNDLAAVATEPRTLKVVRHALERGNDLRLTRAALESRP